MVVQPSIEEHEALINEVKALKEEVKRLRNEKKKLVDLPQRWSCNLKREIVKRVATRGQISTTKILPCTNTKDSWGRRSRQTMDWNVALSGVNAGRGCLVCLG